MNIANIFKSKTRKALFRLYFTNPAKEYYLRELERLLNIPVSMVRDELIRLEKEGIFLSRKKGNSIYYRLNTAYFLFEELKSIVFKTVGVQGLIAKTLKKVKGIETAFIYGSFARDIQNKTSDIDIFIIGRIDENLVIEAVNRLEKSFKREINYSLYTKNEFLKKKKSKTSFIRDLLENKKIFLIGDDNDL